MQFNNGDSLSIVDEINDICQSDSNSYPIAAKTRRVNSAMDRFFTLAFQADGRWAFDDINQTTAPIQSINLVNGTQSYAIDTFISEIINVLRVESVDSTGNKTLLQRLDRNKLDRSLTALTNYATSAGIPTEYDMVGKYIYLYPKPSFNATNGLTFYFERNKSAFTTSDTTKSPGIPSIFHQYICRYASLPYLIEFQKAQKNDIAAQIQVDEDAILDYFQAREKNVPQVIQTKFRNPR